MQLIGKNVLLAEVSRETKSSGGIILTGNTSKAVRPGLVLAVGDAVTNIPVGKRVYVDWSGVLPITHNDEPACIVSADNIKAVF
tara:strand:- start:215 stop:466 length:252 start_codon:yes stop_codon:yes gene_type:complete